MPEGFTTGSVSKALDLQGLGTGWMITRDRAALMDAAILREKSSGIMNIRGRAIAQIALRPDRNPQAHRRPMSLYFLVEQDWVR
jgi:aspartate/methionine/tyrosine aminotransferase